MGGGGGVGGVGGGGGERGDLAMILWLYMYMYILSSGLLKFRDFAKSTKNCAGPHNQ